MSGDKSTTDEHVLADLNACIWLKQGCEGFVVSGCVKCHLLQLGDDCEFLEIIAENLWSCCEWRISNQASRFCLGATFISWTWQILWRFVLIHKVNASMAGFSRVPQTWGSCFMYTYVTNSTNAPFTPCDPSSGQCYLTLGKSSVTMLISFFLYLRGRVLTMCTNKHSLQLNIQLSQHGW